MQMREVLKAAAHVVPNERQLRWFDTEFYGFIHFGVNTYTGAEWGSGKESPMIFNPVELDCDSWVEALKSAGMRGMVLTAKHHDGFCLWPSRYTEHSVKNSPWANGWGDVVKAASDACRRGGIQFGVYLSPWDRNASCYGTPEYNDFYKNQLTELLTGYGELFMVWFDGACGEGPNGKKQVYDFDGYIELIRRYQPRAAIFNDFGPDVRWCGNESGSPRYAEWAVVPSELCRRNPEVVPIEQMLAGDLTHMYNTDYEVGSLSNILYSKGLVFCGSEIDMSIRPGWFYHPEEEPHSLERLMSTYIKSVGGNACFHLNVPPMPSGRFDERDIARLKELGQALQKAFGEELALSKTEKLPLASDTQCLYELTLAGKKAVRYVVLEEDIARGQRIENFQIRYLHENGVWSKVFDGLCVGHKKICPVSFTADKVRIHVTAARDEVLFKKIALY